MENLIFFPHRLRPSAPYFAGALARVQRPAGSGRCGGGGDPEGCGEPSPEPRGALERLTDPATQTEGEARPTKGVGSQVSEAGKSGPGTSGPHRPRGVKGSARPLASGACPEVMGLLLTNGFGANGKMVAVTSEWWMHSSVFFFCFLRPSPPKQNVLGPREHSDDVSLGDRAQQTFLLKGHTANVLGLEDQMVSVGSSSAGLAATDKSK